MVAQAHIERLAAQNTLQNMSKSKEMPPIVNEAFKPDWWHRGVGCVPAYRSWLTAQREASKILASATDGIAPSKCTGVRNFLHPFETAFGHSLEYVAQRDRLVRQRSLGRCGRVCLDVNGRSQGCGDNQAMR